MILIYIIAGWVVGILSAFFLKLPTEVWLLLLLLPLGYLFLFWRTWPLRKWHLVLILFVLGALRFQLALPSEFNKQLAQFNEQGRASLVGIVAADPDIRQTQTLVRVSTTKIQTEGEWREVNGLALVSVPRDAPVKYGDEVQVDGAPETPPDGADFSYRDYLARESIFTLLRNARLYVISSQHGDPLWATIYGFKDAAQQAINQLLPEPSAALLTGILLGDDRGLPPTLKQAFADTNTAHIIAISGFNIAVLIGVLTYVFRRPTMLLHTRAVTSSATGILPRVVVFLTRHLATILIVLFLILYTLLVGASASVVRACIMGSLVLIALEFGRQSLALNALAVAAFIMTLMNPWVLWDVGFQLSFLATLGLLIYAPRMQQRIEGWLKKRVSDSRARQIVEFLKDAFIVTTAAFLVTAPLISVYFHRVSFVGFLTNFLILPVQPAIMILGGAATLLQMLANAWHAIPFLGLVIGGLAQVLAWGAFVCLQYTILVVQATAAIPFGSFEVSRIDAPLVIVFYAALFIGTRLGVKRATGLFLARVWVSIALLALITMFVWTTAVASNDARTRVTFIAASSGDATLIRTANDQRILINGTDEPGTLLSFLGMQFPPWDRRLDVVITTHLDNENLASLNAVLERYNVAQVVEPLAPARPGVSYEKWRALVRQKQIQVIPAIAGAALRAGESTLSVIYPAADGDSSFAALRLQTNGQTLLFAPVLRKADRENMLQADALFDVDVAVLPNELEPGWLERLTPTSVILFVGKSPRDKPSAEMLKLLVGVNLWRTDERGTITYLLDGDKVEVLVEK
ncbi:MAG: ComEC/Rec2 family competence protein [Chloroflexi bacterium]|nr:ComEC/Rec2 family competence protein [Chloroflexota bacterium]